MSLFSVSVIIPVYNAIAFLEEAVESALAQEETEEVLLIEDGSQDDSLSLCIKLAQKYPKVFCYHHPNRQNLGIGASRNLGIEKAKTPYLAFLDADDYFLANRFKKAKEVFLQHADADAVYSALINKFEREELKIAWEAKGHPHIHTMSHAIPPTELFQAIVEKRNGHFLPSSVIIKKETFDKVGGFPTIMKVFAEDIHMFLRISAIGNFYAGEIQKPLGVHRVHGTNLMLEDNEQNFLVNTRVNEDILEWLVDMKVDDEKGKLLLLRCIIDFGKYHLTFSPKGEKRKLLAAKIKELYTKYPQFISLKTRIMARVVYFGLFPFVRKIVMLFSK